MQTTIIHYSLFQTNLGWVGLAWNQHSLIRLHLPEENKEATEQKLNQEFPLLQMTAPPPFVKKTMKQILLLCQGKIADFSQIPIDISSFPAFHQKVYQKAQQISWGKTITYGELANLIDSKGAARAVGQALSKNPIPLIIPCHRILAAGGKIGGFSAYGGTVTKKKLLLLEGARSIYPEFDPQKAMKFLQKQDAILKRLIQKIGPFELFSSPPMYLDPYQALGRSIIYQQLAGKAAEAILKRFQDQLGQGQFPKPEVVRQASAQQLRACGISGAKAAALQSLAEFAETGKLKSREEFLTMPDEEIIQSLLPIRGIGRWTAEMFLLFSLQRPDVLSLGDYGLKKGLQKAYGLSAFPNNKDFALYGEKWKPYRSVASWYLWRVLDAS